MYITIIGSLTGGGQRDDALAHSNATFSLLLTGDVLDLTALNNQGKFRDKGNKAGVNCGCALLKQSGLGELKEKRLR